MIKNFLMLLVCIVSASLIGIAVPSTASAADCGSAEDASFLSFPTWHRGLSCVDGKVDIQGGAPLDLVFTIALNLLDIALRIVGIMAVGFIIYGGFRYIISRGSPEQMKQALDTVLKAVIGAVIAMVAAFIVSFLVTGLSKT